jgi:putative Mg2+ transporter-C (MgtC) family protein
VDVGRAFTAIKQVAGDELGKPLSPIHGRSLLGHVLDRSACAGPGNRLRAGLPHRLGREWTERSAGLRTFPLVAIASCGFIQATEGILRGSPEGNARVVGGLITGIGFIGGGAIVKSGTNARGTATAASLWATGAIGAAVGLGAYDVACAISLFTIATLRLLVPLKRQETSASD